jgi:hypothetical protein
MPAKPYCYESCPFVERQIQQLEEGDNTILERVCPYVAALAISQIGTKIAPTNQELDETTHKRARRVLFRSNVKIKVEQYYNMASACADKEAAGVPPDDPRIGLATVTADDIYKSLLQCNPKKRRQVSPVSSAIRSKTL